MNKKDLLKKLVEIAACEEAVTQIKDLHFEDTSELYPKVSTFWIAWLAARLDDTEYIYETLGKLLDWNLAPLHHTESYNICFDNSKTYAERYYLFDSYLWDRNALNIIPGAMWDNVLLLLGLLSYYTDNEQRRVEFANTVASIVYEGRLESIRSYYPHDVLMEMLENYE